MARWTNAQFDSVSLWQFDSWTAGHPSELGSTDLSECLCTCCCTQEWMLAVDTTTMVLKSTSIPIVPLWVVVDGVGVVLSLECYRGQFLVQSCSCCAWMISLIVCHPKFVSTSPRHGPLPLLDTSLAVYRIIRPMIRWWSAGRSKETETVLYQVGSWPPAEERGLMTST